MSSNLAGKDLRLWVTLQLKLHDPEFSRFVTIHSRYWPQTDDILWQRLAKTTEYTFPIGAFCRSHHRVKLFTLSLLGWKTVLHYGSLIGTYSLITLLPELDLGIFSSYNGAMQTDAFTINSLLHVHLIDLFTGHQPSIDNASHWCSIPDHIQFLRPNVTETRRFRPLYPASAYVGVYWHAVLGDFDVWQDADGALMTRYGSLETRLHPLQSGLHFIGVPTDPSWSILIQSVSVNFSAVNGHQQCRHVTVNLLTNTTFQRRDASVSGSSHSTAAALSVVIITLMLQYYVNHWFTVLQLDDLRPWLSVIIETNSSVKSQYA